MIYVIGSLRNPRVPEVARALREAGHAVFDDWYAAGPEADDYWQRYEQERGHSYREALQGAAARHVFEFDRSYLSSASVGVLVLPAGKSGHLELGWLLGKGRRGYILLDGEPERYDVMYQFATGIATTVEELILLIESDAILGNGVTVFSAPSRTPRREETAPSNGPLA